MSVQIVLKLGDIKGETKVKDKDGKVIDGGIDVVSWKWGMVQKGSARLGTGGGAGAADVDDLIVTKRVDAASPNILKYCLMGTTITGDVILTCYKVGGGTDTNAPKKVDYIQIKLSGTVQIAKVDAGEPETIDGKPTDLLLETIAIHFSEVEFIYTPQEGSNAGKASLPSGKLQIGT